jgi:hypothetical protein
VNVALSSRSSLVVGERTVSRCEDGLLGAEYVLFDRSEVVLSGATGQGVQEQGYLTTAGFARSRLQDAGITANLAREAFAALRTSQLRGLASTPSVLRVVEHLGPYEAFEGGTFVATSGRYAGTWLDLDVLARSCPLRGVAVLLQALHLLHVVEEVADDSPVRLLTAEAVGQGRPGERTWHKVSLEGVQRVPSILRAMRVPPKGHRAPRDEAEVREELLRNLRARAAASVHEQPRLHTLAAQFARTGRTPPAGTAAVLEAVRDTKRSTPRPPPRSPLPPPIAADDPLLLFEELRRHTQLLQGEDHLRAVAQFLSAMADRTTTLPEMAILASRAWLAAGENGHARYLAKRLVEDTGTSDDLRMAALEILDSTPPTNESIPPPSSAEPIRPSPIVVLSSAPDRAAPRGASLPPHVPEPIAPAHFALAPSTQPPARPVPQAPPPRHPEIVETMPLPHGAPEDFPMDARPTDPLGARIFMTRLSRELGRDYRIWYGTTLKTDLLAVDTMQRHLRRRFPEGPMDAKEAHTLEVELTRHGAFLSEILARSLGAEWVDLSSEHPGHWAMVVPPDIRVWPIGRVYRFYRQGHRESDLVAFLMELEAHARASRRSRGPGGS